MTVSGKYFTSDCNDVLTCVEGRPCETPAAERPQTDIEIVFKQGNRTWPLATIDAQPDLTFSIATTVPSEAKRGPAEVVAAPAQPAKFEVGGPPRVDIDKERLKNRNKIPPGQLRKIREQLAGKPDQDDEDVWASFLAAGLAIGLVVLGGLMLRRRSSD